MLARLSDKSGRSAIRFSGEVAAANELNTWFEVSRPHQRGLATVWWGSDECALRAVNPISGSHWSAGFRPDFGPRGSGPLATASG